MDPNTIGDRFSRDIREYSRMLLPYNMQGASSLALPSARAKFMTFTSNILAIIMYSPPPSSSHSIIPPEVPSSLSGRNHGSQRNVPSKNGVKMNELCIISPGE